MDPVRKLVAERIETLGLELAEVSRGLGKNHAYMQQYLKRHVPRELPEKIRRDLAKILKVDEARLKPAELSTDIANVVNGALGEFKDSGVVEEQPDMSPVEKSHLLNAYQMLDTDERVEILGEIVKRLQRRTQEAPSPRNPIKRGA